MAKIIYGNFIYEGTPEELVKLSRLISENENINTYETDIDMNDDDNIYKEFEIGDYAKVIGKTAWSFIEKGEIVRIDDSLGNGRYKIKLIDKPGYDYAEATALDLVSDKDLNNYIKAFYIKYF